MDDDIIVLSDDEAPPAAGPSRVPRGIEIIDPTVTRPAPSVLAEFPARPRVRRSSSTPEVLALSGSSSPSRENGAPVAKQARVDVPSNDDLAAIFDDPMFGGRGGRVPLPQKAASEGADKSRKRKDKGEAEEERKRKQQERDQKAAARDEKRAAEANDKKTRAIEREISASKKSKAEEYIYTRVGTKALDMIPGFEAALRVLMCDRKIDKQLEISPSLESRVEWWRKSVEAVQLEAGGGVERVESMIQEPVEVIVVDAVALAAHVKAGALEQHVVQLRASLGVSNALLILLAHGKLGVKDSERDAQAVVLHAQHKTQIREVHSANEAALFLCQLHRSTARVHTKRAEKIIADVTKGQRERAGLVADWWGKMLAVVPRLSGIYSRALAAAFPSPFALLARIESEGAAAVEAALAEVRTDIGRRIGPAHARKVIALLTTDDGMELFT